MSLTLVAPSNDGAFYRRLVWPADRGSVCLDCRSLFTVVVFEAVKVLLALERSVRETLLGAKRAS